MLGVFNNMAIGLAISAIVAFGTASSPELMQMLFAGPQKWLVMLAPLAMVFFISLGTQTMSPAAARIWFFAFAAVMGLSLSTTFMLYKLGSIVTIFFATAGMFGAMSIYGHTTKQDLTQYGSYFMMALFGVIIAGLVNLFAQSSAFAFAISVVSVVLFAGLTAYDVQMLRQIYEDVEGEDRERAGVLGALALYLDFINMFLSLLQLLGDRK
jgi:FtsH-binding integral membrane protein